MKKAKNPKNQIKQLQNEFSKIYAPPDTTFWQTGFYGLAHDIGLRNVIGKMFNLYPEAEIEPTFPQDAEMILGGQKYYFEYDTGMMSEKALTEKLYRNYLKDGAYRVISFMNNRGH